MVISVWPKSYPGPANFDELRKAGHLYPLNLETQTRDWLGHVYTFFDAFSPQARRLYWRQLERALLAKGVDGWWLDATEPEMLTNQRPSDVAVRMSPTALGNGARVLNAYPLMAARGVFEGQRASLPDRRVAILTRSAWAGSQRSWLGPPPRSAREAPSGRGRAWPSKNQGPAGKKVRAHTVQNLAGFACYADRVKGDKYLRCRPYAAMVQAYNVDLVAGPWNEAYLAELHNYAPDTSGYKDQVDASSGAFNKRTAGRPLDLLNPIVTDAQAQAELQKANVAALEHVCRQGVVFPGEW